MSKTIFDLELHDTLKISTKIYEDGGDFKSFFFVTRVPGGWIYKRSLDNETSVFLPYSKEFERKGNTTNFPIHAI